MNGLLTFCSKLRVNKPCGNGAGETLPTEGEIVKSHPPFSFGSAVSCRVEGRAIDTALGQCFIPNSSH